MTTALVTARRSDAVELAVKLDNVTAAQAKAEKAEKAARLALEMERTASEAKDAHIARLQAIVDADKNRSVIKV